MNTGKTKIETSCNVTPTDNSRYNMDYEHSKNQLMFDWGGLMGHIIFWCVLTVVIQARRKSD